MLLHLVALLPLLILEESPGVVILLDHFKVGLFALFEFLIDASLYLLAEGVHLILLFLHQGGLAL